MFFPPGESLLVPLRLQQSQNDCRWDLLGSGGDRVAGMVYLEAYVGNCPTLFVRSNETPWWSECVVFWESSAWVGLQWWPHPLQVMALISVIHERYSFWKGSRCFFFSPPSSSACVGSCLEQALCLLVACETVSSRKLQNYFMKCSNKNIHVAQPMRNNTSG